MKTRIGMWGGSCAIRLPKMAVETLGMHSGVEVDLELENGKLTIIASKPHYALEDLVEQAAGIVPPDSWDDGASGSEAL